MKKTCYPALISAAAALMILAAGSAHAHNLWLNPQNHYPEAGDTVEIGIGWGHHYTEDRTHQEVKDSTVHEISTIDPDGEKVELGKKSGAAYELETDKPGVYLVTARTSPVMFTTTPEGRKRGSRKDVDRPIKCTAYNILAKTVITAGGKDKNLEGKTGQELEIIPLKNPAELDKGDAFPVRVVFEDQPLSGAKLEAKYAGFEEKGQSGDGHGHDHGAAAEAETDDRGRAEIRLEKKGYWIIMVSHQAPYQDDDTCDQYMYNSAFTFEVK
ncbi:MAG: DUF4198 domain-containing protein [Desulfobacterales bacterium]